MKLHHLRPDPGSRPKSKRLGRGRAAGGGKTAGRGTKGYLAKHNPKLGFEGGQMPLQRRLPKLKGFTNPNRKEYAVVNLDQLTAGAESGDQVTPQSLRSRGLTPRGKPVKVLGRGEVDRALTVKAHAVSATARTKIERAGGSVEILSER